MNTTAGSEALSEIRKYLAEVMEALERPSESQPHGDIDETKEEVISDYLRSLVVKIEGSYNYNGANGWLYALENPESEPFDARKW
jgi:hypothetical protein